MRRVCSGVLLLTLFAAGLAGDPVAAGVEPLELTDGMTVQVGDIIAHEFSVSTDATREQFAVTDVPPAFRIAGFDLDGTGDCTSGLLFVFCHFGPGEGAVVRLEIKAVSAVAAATIASGLIVPPAIEPPSHLVTVEGPVSATGVFTEHECAVLDALASGLGLSVSEVVERSSELLTLLLHLPLPAGEPSPGATCEVPVTFTGVHSTNALFFDEFSSGGVDGFANLSGQLVVAIIVALVRGGAP